MLVCCPNCKETNVLQFDGVVDRFEFTCEKCNRKLVLGVFDKEFLTLSSNSLQTAQARNPQHYGIKLPQVVGSRVHEKDGVTWVEMIYEGNENKGG